MKGTGSEDKQSFSLSFKLAGAPLPDDDKKYQSSNSASAPKNQQSSTAVRRSTRVRKPVIFSESESDYEEEELKHSSRPAEKRRKGEEGMPSSQQNSSGSKQSTQKEKTSSTNSDPRQRNRQNSSESSSSSAVGDSLETSHCFPLTSRRNSTVSTQSKSVEPISGDSLEVNHCLPLTSRRSSSVSTQPKSVEEDDSDLKFPDLTWFDPHKPSAAEEKPQKRCKQQQQKKKLQQQPASISNSTVFQQTIDTSKPYIVNQWLQIVRFGDFKSESYLHDVNVEALLSRVCSGTVWPIGWESHRFFENPMFLQGNRERRNHICSVLREGSGRLLFRIFVDGESLQAENPEDLMKAFRARFSNTKPNNTLSNVWLQSCEHFFGLVSVDNAVRAMDGHDTALRCIQKHTVPLVAPQQSPAPALFTSAELFIPEQPYTLHRRKSHSRHHIVGLKTNESSGSETECDANALHQQERLQHEYGRMTEVRARVLLNEKDAEVARLRALVERAETVVHGMSQVNNQWLALSHIRLSRMIAEHSEMNEDE